MPSVTSPSLVPMRRTSTCSPQAIGQPCGRSGCGGVVTVICRAAAWTASSRSSTVMPAGGGTRACRVVGVDAVEAQQDVEVHRAPALHLGDLAVRHPHRRHPPDPAGVGDDLDVGDAASAAQCGEVAFDGLFGASPQFAGEVVPDDLVVVVVAVQAQRLTELRIVGVVAGEAGRGLPVRAGAGGAAGVAGCRAAVAAPPVGAGVAGDVPVVHRAEGRRGEGGEDDRMRGDRGGDALAAGQAAADDLEGVTGVDPGAVGALGGTAVAARLVERPVGQLVGVPLGEDPAGAGSTAVRVPARRIGRVQPPAARVCSSQPK